MSTISTRQWTDLAAGLAEIRHVTCGPVANLTFDGELAPTRGVMS
jgi:hypothetical protein